MNLFKKQKSVFCYLMVILLMSTSGCTHNLEVKNMSLYKPSFMGTVPEKTVVGIIKPTATVEEERVIDATINGLKKNGFQVVYPFIKGSTDESNLDFLVNFNTSSEYKGSKWNFLINWPGFLIWTPAWHGYDYRVIYKLDAGINDVKNKRDLPNLTMPMDLEIRHAAMNRTWTEISWLEWSAIAFIGGFVFTRYDKNLTPQLLDHSENKIGDYFASKITETVLSVTRNVEVAPSATTPEVPLSK